MRVNSTEPAVATACSGCSLRGDCYAVDGRAEDAPFRGRALVVVSIAYFGLPLATAMFGVLLAGSGAVLELLGGGGGLLVGMTISARVARWLCAVSRGQGHAMG